MNDLADFVLNAFRQEEAIVEPPAYGVHDVLLPDKAAHRWSVPSFLRVAFGDTTLPKAILEEEDQKIFRLGYNHPLVETLSEERRHRQANALAHINNIRLEKRGLTQVARQSVSLPNSRLTTVPRQVEYPALSHYVVFNFKVSLITDEKRERLVPLMMDLQAGHAVANRTQIEALMSLENESAFAGLSPAPVRWMETKGDPLTEPLLSALLERATQAVLDEMATPIENLRRRAARHLELDRARLTEYYDDLARDIQRRIARATDDARRNALEDRTKAIQIEREAKLADIEAKYHLRVEMTLVNLIVITQPKVLLSVQIGDRHAKTRRTVVWDPLLHELEPLACDVCGRPGQRLFFCANGHLIHEECLLGEQCVDCKRLYCHLCADQMSQCAVCDRPVCERSLNRCGDCGRGTCHKHVGLCHAVDGEPARPVERETVSSAEPSPPPEEPPPISPVPPGERHRLSSAKRQAAERSRKQAQRKPRKASREVVAHRIEVYVHPDAPIIDAYVFAKGQKQIAVRTWQLDKEGLGVWCQCEKGRGCTVDGRLLEPVRASDISNQIKTLAEDLAREYSASARHIEWHAVTRGEMRRQTGPVLWGDWRDDTKLALARVGFQVVSTQQLPWSRKIELPAFARRMATSEAIEVGYVTRMAEGLLHFEGVLPQDELLDRVVRLAHPGTWYTPKRGKEILIANSALRQPTSSGLVSLKEAARPATLMKRKLKLGLPPRDFNRLELLNATDPDAPLPKDLARIERKLGQIVDQNVAARQLQVIIKNQPSLESLLEELAGKYQVPEKRTEDWIKWLTQLWEKTPRYESGGRTPIRDQ
jgi:hypothetical protein